MSRIDSIAAELLASGEVEVVIGYGEGTEGRVRPLFVHNKEQTSQLIYNDKCTQNLALYLYRKEVKQLGKPAIVAPPYSVRSVIRLAAENQIQEDELVVIAMAKGGEATVCRTFNEMESWIADHTTTISEEDRELLDRLNAMTATERREYWQEQMQNCIKCYACRQACPLCYCDQCAVEINQPQWVPVVSSTLGNTEWHVMRAMHLAGRCVECGECGRACPVNIPIHLLTIQLAQEVRETYGTVTGMKVDEGCAMSTFKPGDKENFIG